MSGEQTDPLDRARALGDALAKIVDENKAKRQPIRDPYVVTSTPTIMDGTVVRWFADLDSAERCEPLVSASRNEAVDHRSAPVMDALFAAATTAHRTLRHNNDAKFDDLVTHRHRTFLGPLEPVALASSDGQGTDR